MESEETKLDDHPVVYDTHLEALHSKALLQFYKGKQDAKMMYPCTSIHDELLLFVS